MTFYVLALTLGLLSSLHCVGMCTPLQLALSRWLGLGTGGLTLYHLGRIGAYATLGAIGGLLSNTLTHPLLQQYLAYGAAGTIVMVVLLQAMGRLPNWNPLGSQWLQQALQNTLSRLQRAGRSWGVIFLLGAFNGLLPCGMVYLALVGTLAVPGSLEGAGYMVLFGLGTLPALLFSTWVLRRVRVARVPLALAGLAVAALLAYRAATHTPSNEGAGSCANPVTEVLN